jgi:phospholipid/cholesterol/gamma-HCH transport system substrate-binding protein
MTENGRNVIVGVVVLVALILVGVMIMIFTTLPGAFHAGYPLQILADTTYDVNPGLPVHFSGLGVGVVKDIDFTDPHDPTKGVTFHVQIDKGIRLPGNTAAYVFTKGFVGSAWLELKASGPPLKDPRTGKPLEYLPTDGSVPLHVMHQGSSMIPDELVGAINDLRSGFKDLGALARNLNDLLSPPAAATMPEGNAPATAISAATAPAGADVRSTLAKLGKALDGLSAMVGDTESQANFKAALANIAKVSGQAVELADSLKATLKRADVAAESFKSLTTRASGTAERVSGKLVDGIDRLSALMATLNRVAEKMETGDGTAGKFINDPKLYNSLLEVTNQLTSLAKEMRVLVENWEKSGMGIKLK